MSTVNSLIFLALYVYRAVDLSSRSQLAGWCVGEGGLSLLYTQKVSKIAAVNATAWRFGTEDLVKRYFCVIEHENSKETAFYYF
jgi:hypothetical protein